ncbi:DNA repair protein RecN [Dyadobacter chenwenxiniae]|uniref:DNA repair protein RecN n=1 Tax=Dyadobacter chenwenxiniae TaxID=2906456 RepID=A0A9X1TJZ6_9BACT|nr:DNA repair protein RecN [Dyadobacter chenwenxiniae]MCF0060673.1 DNA repair protein RecN [Dyadobacter chenwenxiniae]UON80507.1 DNA repair protein RecN [Dyadobacter chenwenxiniae]
MLSNLLIKNYALIKQLEMSPDPGLNIITGETGAGKSIMLGAIGLLLGNRADVKSLYDSSEKCVIEGSFSLSGYDLAPNFEDENLDYSDDCIIRREISVAGKSRAFINDTPVNLDALKRIGSQLLDIHSQHDSVMLGNNEFQLQVVDSFADNSQLLKSYQRDFSAYKEAARAFENLQQEAVKLRKEFDYDQFLFQELENAKLASDEQEKLEAELNILENAVEIREKLQLAHTLLDSPDNSILELLKNAANALGQAARLVPVYDAIRERVQSTLIELRDVADEIDQANSSVDIDQGRAELVQERLDLIYTLLKKHQATNVDQLLAIEADLQHKLSIVLNLDEDLARAEKTAIQAKEKMLKSANVLSEKRRKVTKAIEKLILERLSELGIPNASLSIQITETLPTANGLDSVAFLFSGNKGIVPQELKQVASGGEFSRLMMVIKYILADKRKLPTIIFDEIDTGVSGEIARKMGKMMLNMAHNHQIIAITHLHQIASSGNAHYFVYKDHSSDKTVSKIKKLTVDERVQEIAQMIGGHNPSETVLVNAREMILKEQT